MLKDDIISGYRILNDFKVAGGMSKIAFAEKNGETYFIKEFLYPKYPGPDSPGSERVKEQKRRNCDEFENHHKALNQKIGECCSGTGGNLIYAIDFFRFGTCYYKVTAKIDILPFPCEKIATLPIERILLIAKSAVHSIRILHNNKIVHGDLKPDNMPIEEVPRGYVVKLIDFDDSYFEGRPPADRETLVGTPEYYSPEQAEYILDEDDETDGSILTCKSDIFTLGIILTEFFTGKKPILPSKYKSTWECVNDGGSISFSKKIDAVLETLIREMLSKNPSDRPTISVVFEILRNFKPGTTTSASTTPPTKIEDAPRTSRLRGDLTKIAKKTEPSTEAPASKSTGGSRLKGKGLDIANK